MSEPDQSQLPERRRDAGMTLPELLIAVTVSALIATMLVAAISVTLRQARGTEGRLNVAQAEQMIGMWLPGDLASASTVSTDPAAKLCYGEACPITPSGGSSALLVTWEIEGQDDSVVRTSVMYYFAPAPGDTGRFELTRYACDDSAGSWSCSSTVVLRDLDPPPPGLTFEPGATRPDWVIQVSEPLSPDGIDEDDVLTSTENVKNARRVVVTVNGGGATSGSGGGTNQISITAGGTARSIIDGTSLQGAPTFTEALSKCGGPLVLVVDESNSIGGAIGTVKQAVKDFVLALAGTPVQLQIIGFHTYSHALGTSDWHRYYDMTNDADVDELYAAVDILKGSWTNTTAQNGGTNWEEALYRTFSTPEGTTAPVIPETVVFFTDGVPTFDRLVKRTVPGILPAEPPDPGEPWPDSTGSDYSQVAYNRANFIATWARASVNLVGVGVGTNITGSSTWISDPGAGYHLEWERGSYSHVRQSTTYYLRYQKKNSSNGAYYWVNKATYDAANSNRRRDQGWTAVTEETYRGVENPPNTNNSTGWGTDGAYWVTTQTPVSTAEYQANASDPAYVAVTKTWAAGPDWEPWTGSRSGISSSQLRSTKVYAQPYEDYDSPTTQSVRNDRILGRLIAGGDNYVTATWDSGTSQYTNVATANLYTSTNWAQLPLALKAIALGECGGTLTLQTRIGSSPAPDPFTYQNSQQFAADGTLLTLEPKVVRTNRQFTTGTFEFDIADGLFRDVVILPENLSDLGAFQPAGWTCRAGNQTREFEVVDIPGAETSAWKGIKVRVGANEAVSCIQTVTR